MNSVLLLVLLLLVQVLHAERRPSNSARFKRELGVTNSFAFTGSYQSVTVPGGVSSMTVTASGAGGNTIAPPSAPTCLEGKGATVVQTFSVTPGTVYYVYVGGQGKISSAGFNGGGSGMSAYSSGGSGATDVRTVVGDLSSRIIVAGGGGGCDVGYSITNGGNGGLIGGNGDTTYYYYGVSITGGFGGTATAGGSGSGSGSLGQGGSVSGYAYGGGGGGGYYGGGAGPNAAGGGGSSYPTNAAVTDGAWNGDGFCTILFNYAPSVSPTIKPTTMTPSVNPTVKPTTFIPTLIPTLVPTVAPSIVPTLRPTAVPTISPSALPSTRPSVTPSAMPSQNPSVKPTCLPSIVPSEVPSVWPTIDPSNSPSFAPTDAPSFAPTTNPSVLPSGLPTMQPSMLPSVVPSQPPTSGPTTQPSLVPSISPSILPSITPSRLPTTIPSLQPSLVPSTGPSVVPTVVPSIVPSVVPSLLPSEHPSVKPSLEPSIEPTAIPSLEPSIEPTAIPSLEPSIEPTAIPSLHPTENPSTLPSVLPSMKPTTLPTVLPTLLPTVLPTVLPSEKPTVEPSLIPTLFPTKLPSILPSLPPTVLPTVMPTTEPSIAPSAVPSVVPSIVPSALPTAKPSLLPTTPPSVGPSEKPSMQPTVLPTAAPSLKPSIVPSVTPSIRPSVCPSTEPSASPTMRPSLQPSLQPSVRPSLSPTEVPSCVPSDIPSESPTVMPTVVPSVQPSRVPSKAPSMSPSEIPSALPSAVPSIEPSVIPSELPSAAPSLFPSVNPTIGPTTVPSVLPSQLPSCTPSLVPSTSPTMQPSVVPSVTPSLVPTVSPTRDPSTVPTVWPSIVPTLAPTLIPSSFPVSVGPTVFPSGASPMEQPSASPNGMPTVRLVATLPHVDGVSVIRPDNWSFRIVLYYDLLSSGPVDGQAFSDIFVDGAQTGDTAELQMGSRTAFDVNDLLMAYAVGADSKLRSVELMRDINGDGFDDLIIGDPYSAKCYVLFGNSSGLVQMTTGFTIFGETEGDLTGWSVSDAGDVNNDTLHDFIIGAPFVRGVGAFYVIYGRRTEVSYDVYLSSLTESQGFAVYGSRNADYLGISVSGAGDVNGDGFDDVVVGAVVTVQYFSGSVAVVYGGKNRMYPHTLNEITSTSGYVLSGSSYSYTGCSVSRAGDVNGDGIADVIIGSNPKKAAVKAETFLILGSSSSRSNAVLTSLNSDQAVHFPSAGVIVSEVNDFNSDGLSDFMIISKCTTNGMGCIVTTNVSFMSTFTYEPSQMPTFVVTSIPTPSPTTRSPTMRPSRGPSRLPTQRPSAPTMEPIAISSEFDNPTLEPSEAPSEIPTEFPSEMPSIEPSASPSESPTLAPTVIPSVVPSEAPVLTSEPSTINLPRFPFAKPTTGPTETPLVLVHIDGGGTFEDYQPGVNYDIDTSEIVTIYNAMGNNSYAIHSNPLGLVVIEYFNNSNDRIDLSSIHSLTSYSQLDIRSGSVIITLPSNQIVKLMNLYPADITENNFVFYPSEKKKKTNKVVRRISVFAGVTIGIAVFIVSMICFCQCGAGTARYFQRKLPGKPYPLYEIKEDFVWDLVNVDEEYERDTLHDISLDSDLSLNNHNNDCNQAADGDDAVNIPENVNYYDDQLYLGDFDRLDHNRAMEAVYWTAVMNDRLHHSDHSFMEQWSFEDGVDYLGLEQGDYFNGQDYVEGRTWEGQFDYCDNVQDEGEGFETYQGVETSDGKGQHDANY